LIYKALRNVTKNWHFSKRGDFDPCRSGENVRFARILNKLKVIHAFKRVGVCSIETG